MSFDRVTAGSGPGAEPAPAPGSAEAVAMTGLPPAIRLQILSTEHWSLIASRSLAWNESFSRAGMFLSSLSGAIVALALVSQASAFGEGFVWFALMILPVVLFIGIGTFVRLGASNYHDLFCVAGMNRIRAAYLELAPDLERYFVASGHDDARGIDTSMGTRPGHDRGLVDLLAATPSMIAIINGVIVGVIVGLVGIQIDAGTSAAIALGIGGFVVGVALQFGFAVRKIRQAIGRYQPLFPGPTTD